MSKTVTVFVKDPSGDSPGIIRESIEGVESVDHSLSDYVEFSKGPGSGAVFMMGEIVGFETFEEGR